MLSRSHGAAILPSGEVIQWRVGDDKVRVTQRANATQLAIADDKVAVLSNGKVFILDADAGAVEPLTVLQLVMGHAPSGTQIRSPTSIQHISVQGNQIYAAAGSTLYSCSIDEDSLHKVDELESKIKYLSSGSSHTLVKTADCVYGVGSNQFGQLAHPISTSTAKLGLTKLPVKCDTVKAGEDSSFFIDGNKVYGCGNGLNGQLGMFAHAQRLKLIETGFKQYWKDGALHDFKIIDFDCWNHSVYLVDVGDGFIDLLLAGRHDGSKAKVGGCVWDEVDGKRVQFHKSKGCVPCVSVGEEQTVVWFKKV